MMNIRISVRGYLLPFLLASLLFAFPALAAVKPQDVKTIYDLSSLEQQSLNLSRTFIEEGLMLGRQELSNDSDKALLSRLEADLGEHYDPERLKKVILSVLNTALENQALDSQGMQKIINTMNTQAWRWAVTLERKANSVVGTKKLEEYVTGKLQQQTPRQIRVDLIKQLVASSDMTTLMMELMISASLTTAKILLPQEEAQIQFEAEIRNQVESMRVQYNELIIQQLLYTYRYMPDEQLTTYVNYYKTPAIAKLNRAISQALQKAFE